MTPEQLQRLRHSLPPFGERGKSLPELQTYSEYYGLDFEAEFPLAEHLVGCVQSGEYSLAVHRWLHPEATTNLLLLHGYFDHTGLFNKLIKWGLSRNCNILIFDLPGHGLSSGEAAVIDDFGDYSRAIADVLGAVQLPELPLWSMAQSTGGAALVDYAGKYPWPFAATVLLAPLVRPTGWRWIRPGELLLGRFIDSVTRGFAANSSDQDFLAFVRREPLQSRRVSLRWVAALRRWLDGLQQRDLGVGPALVIQGDADSTVDWRFNVGVIRQLFPGSEVDYLAGAGHHLANESEDFRRDYLSRVESWLTQRGVVMEGFQE